MNTRNRRWMAQAERLSMVFMTAVWVGAFAAALVAGIFWGVALDRKPPAIYSLQVIGDTHAGGDIRVREKVVLPDNCLPRVTRKIVFPPDDESMGQNRIQVVSDSTVTGQGDIMIPLSRDTPVGTGRFYETVSTQGCGVISGILPPLIADAHDIKGSLGVGVTVLPLEPVLAKTTR